MRVSRRLLAASKPLPGRLLAKSRFPVDFDAPGTKLLRIVIAVESREPVTNETNDVRTAGDLAEHWMSVLEGGCTETISSLWERLGAARTHVLFENDTRHGGEVRSLQKGAVERFRPPTAGLEWDRYETG